MCFGTLISVYLLSNEAMPRIPAHKGPGLADYEARTDTTAVGGVVVARISATADTAEIRG